MALNKSSVESPTGDRGGDQQTQSFGASHLPWWAAGTSHEKLDARWQLSRRGSFAFLTPPHADRPIPAFLASPTAVKAPFLITIALVIMLYPVLVATAFWISFRRAGLAVKTVNFFRGPRLFRGTLFGDPVEIGCIPIGSSVSWVPEQYFSKPRLLRLGVTLIAPILGLAITMMLLGSGAAIHHIGRGLMQIPMGALHPRSLGVELIAQLQTVFAHSPVTAIGILVAKALADDLLPLGGSVVCNCVFALIDSRTEENRIVQLFGTLNALTAIALCGSWFVAIVSYALTASP